MTNLELINMLKEYADNLEVKIGSHEDIGAIGTMDLINPKIIILTKEQAKPFPGNYAQVSLNVQ